MYLGKLTIFCGPMMAGKTSHLLKEISRAKESGLKVSVIKPRIDNRFSSDDITTHDGIKLKSFYSDEIIQLDLDDNFLDKVSPNIDVLFVDECQFFSNFENSIETLLLKGIDIVAVGLDLDSSGNPFGSMPRLLAKANSVKKLTAKCVKCGESASRTHRKNLANQESQILIGGSEIYEPRCLKHWKEKE